MKKRDFRNKNPYESPFLGLFTGKKKKAEAAAEVQKIEAETESKLKIAEAERQNLLLQLEAAKQGYTPEADAAASQVALEQTKQSGEKTLYVVIGFIVVVVMAGLFFIKKK